MKEKWLLSYILILLAHRSQEHGRCLHRETPPQRKDTSQSRGASNVLTPVPSPLCFGADLTREHAEGMNETERGTWPRWVLAHLTMSSYCNGPSGLLWQHMVLEPPATVPQGFRTGRGISMLYAGLWHRLELKHNRGTGVLGAMHGWSVLSCAEARGFRSHHSYVFGTGFLPTAEGNGTYSVRCTPHRSYIPEDRLLHKRHHRVWLYSKWLLLLIVDIAGCPREAERFLYTRVTSFSLKLPLRSTGY